MTLGELLVYAAFVFFVGTLITIVLYDRLRKRFSFTRKRCEFCKKRMYFWQELTRGKFAHIPCLDKDYWSRDIPQDIKDFHFKHFGTRPWLD